MLNNSKSTDEWWVCECGNRPDMDGFFPSDIYGSPVEPTPEEWDGSTWICANCLTMFSK